MAGKTNHAFGSLAALAAAVLAPQSQAAVLTSLVSNVSILDRSDVSFDIDGDGADDFFLHPNSSYLSLNAIDNNGIAASDSIPVSFAGGVGVGGDSTYENFVGLWSETEGLLVNPGLTYVGVSFADTGSQNHYGWLRFNFPDNDPLNGVLEAAAWESSPDSAISVPVTPVPEPVAIGTVAGLALLGWTFARRGTRAVM